SDNELQHRIQGAPTCSAAGHGERLTRRPSRQHRRSRKVPRTQGAHIVLPEVEPCGLPRLAGVGVPFKTVCLTTEPPCCHIETTRSGEQVDSIGLFHGGGLVLDGHHRSIAGTTGNRTLSQRARRGSLVREHGQQAVESHSRSVYSGGSYLRTPASNWETPGARLPDRP